MKLRFIKLALLAVLSVCFISAYAQDAASHDDYDVFLLIGQSNMAGRGYMIEGDEDMIDENVFILNDKGEVVPARNPLNQYSSIRKDMSMQRISPALGFAKRLAKKTDRKILLVVNARGGTSIAQWKKGEGGDGFYEEAVRRTRQALEYGNLKAILWHQGCADVRNVNTYMDSLSDMVSNLRTDLGSEVPFVAGELGHWRAHVAAFNDMLHTISKHIPSSAWVSAKGCGPIVTKKSNGQPDLKDPHFDRESQIVLGERYAAKVLKMCY